MKAMIMAAGVGSRLMPMTAEIPKPMVPMMNRPLMVHIVELLRNHGFTDIMANIHYKSEVISEYFGDGRDFGVSLHFSHEKELLGTAGGVKNCEAFLDDTFVVVSGDALTDIDLDGLLHAHRSQGSLATIALKEVEDVESFGIVVLADDGRISSFQEKPSRAEALGCTANTGIYVFEPEIFQYIPSGQFYDFGTQVFPHLVKAGAPFFGTPISQYWCDIGCLEVYRRAHCDILAGRVQAAINGQIVAESDSGRAVAARPVQIGNNISWEGTVVLGAGCRIEDGARLKNSIIWEGSTIGAGARIEESVIGQHCNIGGGFILPPGSAIASGSNITSGSIISSCIADQFNPKK